MAINLDKQIGPFPLKIWLVIGIGGIGVGLYAAKHLSSTGAPSTSGIAVPASSAQAAHSIGNEQLPVNGLIGFVLDQNAALQSQLSSAVDNANNLDASSLFYQNLLRARQSGASAVAGTTFGESQQDILSGIKGGKPIGITSTV